MKKVIVYSLVFALLLLLVACVPKDFTEQHETDSVGVPTRTEEAAGNSNSESQASELPQLDIPDGSASAESVPEDTSSDTEQETEIETETVPDVYQETINEHQGVGGI